MGGSGKDKLTSTDVDRPPQSVQFIRSVAATSFKGKRASTTTVTPVRKDLKSHPSNTKFEGFKKVMAD